MLMRGCSHGCPLHAAVYNHAPFLGQVKQVLQKLASVNPTPSVALNEAAELLCKHLSVSMCR